MDAVVSLGRAFNNITFVVMVLFGIGLIAFGTYAIVENERPESKPGKEDLPSNLKAGLMVLFGLLLIPGAWKYRLKVQTDDRYAAIAGINSARGIYNFIKA